MDGHLYAVDTAQRLPTERVRVGGWVRDLALAQDGLHAYAAGYCGVVEVDLVGWLGG